MTYKQITQITINNVDHKASSNSVKFQVVKINSSA